MDICTVLMYVESRYRVNRKKIKSAIVQFLTQQGISRPSEVSIAIVGKRRMRVLNNKYCSIDKPTNVLSFSQTEGELLATLSSSETLYLGDVVVCYPIAVEEAAKEEKLVDDRITELIIHGINHLLGIHH